RAAVGLDDGAADIQTQAQAREAPPPGVVIGLVKALEYEIELFGGDADALIGQADRDAVRLPSRGQRDGSALRRVLERVVQQVGEHLRDAVAIRLHRQR